MNVSFRISPETFTLLKVKRKKKIKIYFALKYIKREQINHQQHWMPPE